MSTPPQGTRVRLGDVLIEKGLLTQQRLDVALAEQKRHHRPLGEILVSLGFVRPDQIAGIMADALGIPLARARDLDADPVLVAALDSAFVRLNRAFPVKMIGGSLQVAMCDPADPQKVAAVRQRFPYPLDLVMITEDDLAVLIRKYLNDSAGQVSQLLEPNKEGADGEFPVEQVTLALLLDGVHQGATDIHIEPEEKVTRVRYRIDGMLHGGENLPREATDAILSRIKILAHMDIAERRRPQDGRLRIDVDGRQVDMRVSYMPTVHGENVVMRILDSGSGGVRLGRLGISLGAQTMLKRVAERPHGLFLVTGPTGSGKTTTLYAMLGEVDAIHRNVATIEDPVEYAMPLVRQSQVEPAAGYHFLDGLRSLLRQDPDVILVGEIRDHETANMAIKASMTGHLVFATLHTNDAIGAVPRLADLGIPPYLVEDTLIGVLAQRLVRRVCENCAEPYEMTPEEQAWMDGDPGGPRLGAGCDHCDSSGLSGRTVICELFFPSDDLSDLMRGGADALALRKAALAGGFKTMNWDGREKIRQGVTTIEEIQRVNRSHRLSAEEREDI